MTGYRSKNINQDEKNVSSKSNKKDFKVDKNKKQTAFGNQFPRQGNPSSFMATPSNIQALQSAIGNNAIQSQLESLQKKSDNVIQGHFLKNLKLHFMGNDTGDLNWKASFYEYDNQQSPTSNETEAGEDSQDLDIGPITNMR